MFRSLLSKLNFASRRGRPDRVSILLPFLIISCGLGVLAWRSYFLSVRTEQAAKALALQSASYAAEITASRVNAAVRTELGVVSDEWQQMERRVGDPTFVSLRDWIAQQDWIVSAIYVPDFDPASSIYVTELATRGKDDLRMTREFYTAKGMIRYTYDPRRLMAMAAPQQALHQHPLGQKRDAAIALGVDQPAEVRLVRAKAASVTNLPDGYAVIAPLAPPLDTFGIRSVVRTAYVGGSGWQNQRVLSLWMSLLALVLLSVGALLALRGMHKEQETMSLRGALIANVSHELRTPLSMIRLGAETLKRGKLKEKERAEIEDQILREVLLLSHLVENVLDVARIQNRSTRALAFTPVHPRDLITNLLTTYESWIRSKGFTYSLHIDETIGEQMWDRDSVSRALLNLVDNAIKYSAEEKALEIVLRQDDEHVIIEVKDRGIGIPAGDLSKIFDPYYRAHFSDTTTRRGAGLGLTLVQQILASHGGRVEVESTPGSGSTFRLLFPRGLAGDPAEVAVYRAPREAF